MLSGDQTSEKPPEGEPLEDTGSISVLKSK